MPANIYYLEKVLSDLTGEAPDAIKGKIKMGVNLTRDSFNKYIFAGGSEDDFYRDTDAYIYELSNWEGDPYKASLADFAGRNFPKQTAVLDFGCGIGTVMNDLADAGFTKIDGVDINRKNRDFIIERFHDRTDIRVGVFEKLEDAGDNYGIVTCLHVLEHVANPADVLLKIKKRMSEGGVFFGVAPFSQVGPEFPEHRMQFKDLKLENLLAYTGFSVLNVVPFGGYGGYTFELVTAVNKRAPL
jgi:2-polyprenyl-3-methyl-5-hydroxy-6-metoxy-1,4-benzoquinol methylase